MNEEVGQSVHINLIFIYFFRFIAEQQTYNGRSSPISQQIPASD